MGVSELKQEEMLRAHPRLKQAAAAVFLFETRCWDGRRRDLDHTDTSIDMGRAVRSTDWMGRSISMDQ